jgi:hypothetical protein
VKGEEKTRCGERGPSPVGQIDGRDAPLPWRIYPPFTCPVLPLCRAVIDALVIIMGCLSMRRPADGEPRNVIILVVATLVGQPSSQVMSSKGLFDYYSHLLHPRRTAARRSGEPATSPGGWLNYRLDAVRSPFLFRTLRSNPQRCPQHIIQGHRAHGTWTVSVLLGAHSGLLPRRSGHAPAGFRPYA